MAAADLAAYALLLREQGGPVASRVFFIGAVILVVILLGLGTLLLSRPALRAGALGFTLAAGLVLGWLGIFSIGLPLIAIGALSGHALARQGWRPVLPMALGAGVAVISLLVGFLTTSLS